MVIKPLSFVNSHSIKDHTFHLGIYSILKISCYTYLGILFSDYLSFQLDISSMQAIVRKILFAFQNFITNSKVLLSFKKQALQSYIISKALYYVPLLYSNKIHTRSI